MLTARGWQEWVVHVSAYHLMGNLVQQMDFTVLCHWQLDLWAKELLFEKVPRREIRFLPWGVCSNCRNAILMTFLNSWRFWRSLCPERSLHIHLRNAGGCVDIALRWAYFVREGLRAGLEACGLAGWWWARVAGWAPSTPCQGLQHFTEYCHRTSLILSAALLRDRGFQALVQVSLFIQG